MSTVSLKSENPGGTTSRVRPVSEKELGNSFKSRTAVSNILSYDLIYVLSSKQLDRLFRENYF